MDRNFMPEAGDIVWLHFDPQAGHEQARHRPALVLSPSAYNGKTCLMLGCPMTTQVKSLDWVVRKANRKGKVSSFELAEVKRKIFALIGEP